jgi:nitroreductase
MTRCLNRCADAQEECLLPELNDRFSCRRFVPDVPLSEQQVTLLIQGACRAPSGCNRQPWRFVVVQNKDTIAKMSELTFKQQFIEDASCVIVVLGDPSVREKMHTEAQLAKLCEHGAFSKSEIEDVLSAEFMSAATDPAQTAAKIVRDCALAAYSLMLQATRMGLGTCWISIKDKAGLRKLCGIPDNLLQVCMLAVGKPVSLPSRPRPRGDAHESMYSEFFGKKWQHPV